MPGMQTSPIAVLCADLHLSDLPPIARRDEPNWYLAMARPLSQLRNLASRLDVPVICAGDIFHKWDSPARLINFAIDMLPPYLYAIPGQHDLPQHRYSEIRKTSFWTLVAAGSLTEILPKKPWTLETKSGRLRLHGFPWGHRVSPWEPDLRPDDMGPIVHLAVVHDYIWSSHHKYQGAPPDQRLSQYATRLAGYTAAVFGDNHKGFLGMTPQDKYVLNCGGFMRRNTDQVDYKPKVGILYANGEIGLHELDCSQDILTVNEEILRAEQIEIDLTDYIEELQENDEEFNYSFEVHKYLKEHRRIDPAISKLLLESIGE